MKKLTVAACVGLASIWAQAVLAANVDKANFDAYLTASDPGGTTSPSFSTAGNWNPKEKPQAGRTYLIQGTGFDDSHRLWARATGSGLVAQTFAGDSLTLDDGELRIHGLPAVVNNLIVYNGMIWHATAGTAVTLAGQTHIQPNGSLHFKSAPKRVIDMAATIDGDATTKLVVDAGQSTDDGVQTTLPYSVTKLTGDSPDFKGSVEVKGLSQKWPSALILKSATSAGSANLDFMDYCALFGEGANLTDRTISGRTGFVVGAVTNGVDGYGLRLGAGVTVSGTGSLVVSNVESAVTRLGDVAFSGFTGISVKTAGVQFDPGFCPTLSIASAHDLTVRFDDDVETWCELGEVSLADGALIRIVYTGNVQDLATNKNDVTAFCYPILKMPGLGTTLQSEDFVFACGSVPGASLVIKDGILYYERTETSKYVYLSGWAGAGMTQGDCWTKASLTTDGKTMSWSDGAAPSSGKNYVVPYCQSLRCRTTTGFAGKSLTILNGGSVSYSDNANFYLGAPLVGCSGGMLLQRTTGTTRTVHGPSVTLPDGGLDQAFTFATEGPDANGVVPKMTVTVPLSGSGNIDFHGISGGDVSHLADFHRVFSDWTKGDRSKGKAEFVISADNTAFTGGISMQSTGGSLVYTTSNSLGGDPARFLKGGLTVAGGTKLVIQADISCGATRGVCFDLPYPAHPDATFEIAAGKTLTLAGAASGAANRVKTGSGALALNGASTATGVTRLEAGTLELGDPAALGAGNLVVAEGTTLRLACAGVKVGGEVPFAKPDGTAVDSIDISVAALDDPATKLVELFVLSGVAAFDCTKLHVVNAGSGTCRFLTDLRDDGLHVSYKRVSGLVLIFK